MARKHRLPVCPMPTRSSVHTGIPPFSFIHLAVSPVMATAPGHATSQVISSPLATAARSNTVVVGSNSSSVWKSGIQSMASMTGRPSASQRLTVLSAGVPPLEAKARSLLRPEPPPAGIQQRDFGLEPGVTEDLGKVHLEIDPCRQVERSCVDDRVGPLPTKNQPFGLEPGERIPKGCPTHAETGGQLGLTRQGLTFRSELEAERPDLIHQEIAARLVVNSSSATHGPPHLHANASRQPLGPRNDPVSPIAAAGCYMSSRVSRLTVVIFGATRGTRQDPSYMGPRQRLIQ